MAGTKQWQINIAFFVEADNDDDALYNVTKTLPFDGTSVVWIWQSSKQLSNKGDASE
jgi:hypothetical protein